MSGDPSIITGVWHSIYTYESSSRGAMFTDERGILIARLRTQVTGMSLDAGEFGRLRMDLNTEGRLVTVS